MNTVNTHKEQSIPASMGGKRTTAQLSEMALKTTCDTLPVSVVVATKRIILDTIAVTIGAYDTPMAKALLNLKRNQGGRGEATLVVEGTKLPAASVAYVHGQLANLLDADDTLLNRGHLACASVMAALAVAEKVGASGKELIAAVATGYDIAARVGFSFRQFVTREDGTVIFAPLFGFSWMSFGVAAAAGKLLGLDREQLARSLGQAYVTTPLIYSVVGQNRPFYQLGEPANWHKYQMAGASAEAGINAALLAADGFVAQTDILDEGSEFWHSFGALGCDWNFMYDRLGQRWFIEETSIKPYPFCRFGNIALDLFSAIVKDEDLSLLDIDVVTVRIPPFTQLQQLCENACIDEPLKLMASVPSAFALIARRVPPGPQWFAANFEDPGLRAFVAKVRTEANPEWSQIMVDQIKSDGIFRRIPTEIVVSARGSTYRKSAEYALGDPWAPGHEMSDGQLADKTRHFTAGLLPPEKTEDLIRAVLTLEQAADVSTVARAMCR
ncbi:MAG: MmgE/PrpD family protein [Sterolibacterium sp.]|nr:MmgE/PrpD family protein [Sterolibacterium sp.]